MSFFRGALLGSLFHLDLGSTLVVVLGFSGRKSGQHPDEFCILKKVGSFCGCGASFFIMMFDDFVEIQMFLTWAKILEGGAEFRSL